MLKLTTPRVRAGWEFPRPEASGGRVSTRGLTAFPAARSTTAFSSELPCLTSSNKWTSQSPALEYISLGQFALPDRCVVRNRLRVSNRDLQMAFPKPKTCSSNAAKPRDEYSPTLTVVPTLTIPRSKSVASQQNVIKVYCILLWPHSPQY